MFARFHDGVVQDLDGGRMFMKVLKSKKPKDHCPVPSVVEEESASFWEDPSWVVSKPAICRGCCT